VRRIPSLYNANAGARIIATSSYHYHTLILVPVLLMRLMGIFTAFAVVLRMIDDKPVQAMFVLYLYVSLP
jgi:hypothetical protein